MNELLLKECTYIQARGIAAQITMEAMKAANTQRFDHGFTQAYNEEAFIKIIDDHGLNHNQIIQAFQNCY